MFTILTLLLLLQPSKDYTFDDYIKADQVICVLKKENINDYQKVIKEARKIGFGDKAIYHGINATMIVFIWPPGTLTQEKIDKLGKIQGIDKLEPKRID